MTTNFFRTTALSLLAAAAINLMVFSPAKAEEAKPMSKSEVEQVIHDYLLSNPEVILQSVNDYQRKSTQDKQDKALEKNRDSLFKDASDPETGNAKGDVTMVEFFDYNCHYCKNAFSDIQTLLKKDKNIRFVFKEFPILGPSSETAAKWALAADQQKKYYEFHTIMMQNKQPISDEVLEKAAKDAGMDVEKAKKYAEGTEVVMQIEKNRSLASQLGLNGTPAFVIGSEIIPGGISLGEMERRIAEQRKAKK